MKGKLIAILIAGALLLGILAPHVAMADITDPIGSNASLFNINTENGGESLITLTITNKLDTAITVEISGWPDYTDVGEGDTAIDPSWLEDVSPATQLVPGKGAMTSNITFNIPSDAAEVRYRTWLKIKVFDYPQEGGYWEKPITVIIRKGAAADTIDFGVTPAYYRLLVDQNDAHIFVSDSGVNQYTSYTPIIVKNKCGASMLAYATAEDRNSPLVISENSAIAHTEHEVGLSYENISTEQAQEWFYTTYTLDNPLSVEAQKKGSISWNMNIPDDVPNGHYVFGVRVASADNLGNNVNIDYMIWMLVDVDRHASAGVGGWLWETRILVSVAVLAALVVILPKLWEWYKRRSQSNARDFRYNG